MPYSPTIANVAPRVFSHETGDEVLLTDYIEQLVSAGKTFSARIIGAGKSIAVAHAAAHFGDIASLTEANLEQHQSTTCRILFPNRTVTLHDNPRGRADFELSLVPWSRDDHLEFLLARYPERAPSVMLRLADFDPSFANGSPIVWSQILTIMASMDSAISLHSIVAAMLGSCFENQNQADQAADVCIKSADDTQWLKEHAVINQSVERLLRHADVRQCFAADRIAVRLRDAQEGEILQRRYDHELLKLVAQRIAGDDDVHQQLARCACAKQARRATNAATLLHLSGTRWRPTRIRGRVFVGGYFAEADWPGIDLTRARLNETVLHRSNLCGASFYKATVVGVDLSHCRLTKAKLHGASLRRTNLSGSDLSEANAKLADFAGANLRKASLVDCNLTRASLCGADLSDADLRHVLARKADFRGARLADTDLTDAVLNDANCEAVDFSTSVLTKTSFCQSRLYRSSFEDAVLHEAAFDQAVLVEAELTGSVMISASMFGADLRRARLAEISWEGCDLRKADLRQSSFHMGSSRSGLVNSPFPSHGTRTGFYTDDYEDLYFKRPEEIRKANLCGTDLRGAKLADVDFYLVDLRGARFDAVQRNQLINTGAILDDDVY